MACALNSLNTGILSVGNQVGMSGAQVINAYIQLVCREVQIPLSFLCLEIT